MVQWYSEVTLFIKLRIRIIWS